MKPKEEDDDKKNASFVLSPPRSPLDQVLEDSATSDTHFPDPFASALPASSSSAAPAPLSHDLFEATVPNLDHEKHPFGSLDIASVGGATASSSAADGSSSGAALNESVMAAIDMLCDDLFACKLEVLRSFARARHVYSGTKTLMVTRLIERANADAHGENTDLSVTRRLLGDVFDGSDIRVSGVRSAWTNQSLEASHIEAACERHFKFQGLANSNKTLFVRRHGAETIQMTRKLSRPFQESHEMVLEEAVKLLMESLQQSAHQPAGPDSTDENAPQTSPADSEDEPLTAARCEAIHDEVVKLIAQLSTTELLSPFAAFMISYIRYGASMNLLSRVDVIDRVLQMGVVSPTIEEEDVMEEQERKSSSVPKDEHSMAAAAATSPPPSSATSPPSSFSSLQRSSSMKYGQQTLKKLMSLFGSIVSLVKQRNRSTLTGGTSSQRISFDCPDFILLDVLHFAQKTPTDHWPTKEAPSWVLDLTRTFLNWEVCVRTDLQTFADAPSYFFDTMLAGVVHAYLIEKLYGTETISTGDIVVPLRGALKLAIEKMFDGDTEKATAAAHELMVYVNATGETSKGFSGDFFLQVLSQMRGVFDMGRTSVGTFVEEDEDDMAPLAQLEKELELLEDKENLSKDKSTSAEAKGQKPQTAPTPRPARGERRSEADEVAFYHKRIAMVMKEIGKTVSRCTRGANLLDLLVRVTEDVHFHLRFFQVFKNLDPLDKTTIRMRRATQLQKTLTYFEQEQRVQRPLSVEAVTLLVLMLTYFSMRPKDGYAPVLIRYESVMGIPELSLVSLKEKGAATIRDLRVAFPPQLSYRSWLQESDTKDKSVYRVLPSVAVKGPTNEAMIISQAPMMRALDAISSVPWRIHRYLLHVQEAMVREGYGFGKLRPAFYPLHYTSLSPGVIQYKVKDEETLTQAAKKQLEVTRALQASPAATTAAAAGCSETTAAPKRRAEERGNENSIFGVGDEENGKPNADGDVTGCNIKERMAYDLQQANDWKALSDVRSSRTHYLQALRQARSIVQFSHLYFPNSMDFRGRMYPLPGRLNHTGSDPFRALLEYADPKPLGKEGLYWLKIHLANKMGMTKLSFDERVAYVDEHEEDVIRSAENPLQGECWWQEASEPFQCLMACKELADALKYSQGAELFPSRLPVAVDGSYNGLQHYSAIGRDAYGAQLVNLVPSERPADAYTGILKEMMGVMERDARKNHPVAQRCLGSGKGQDKNHIKRKTIKRPIMTQVYGVTSYGMSEQIFDELTKQNKSHGLWTQSDMKEMAMYLKDKVLDSLGITFRETQRCREWIRTVSKLVFDAQPPELHNALCWTTPLGLVVRQPYRSHKDHNLFTMQGFSRIPGDVIGAAGRKQLTAVAPNLIHSLDATHLAMTALEMQKEGLYMMAVHDSYWTHACDLPMLSKILRKQFVQLYSQHDPLWELKEQWEEAFFHDLRRHGVTLPDPPERGTLDLNVVLDSPYFFS